MTDALERLPLFATVRLDDGTRHELEARSLEGFLDVAPAYRR